MTEQHTASPMRNPAASPMRDIGASPMRIAGIGAVTGYGWSRTNLWDGLMSGKPAATLTPGFGPGRDEDVWVSLVPSSGGPDVRGGRTSAAVTSAVNEALADARARGWRPGPRVGLLHAVVLPEYDEWRRFYTVDDRSRSVRDFLSLMPSTIVSNIMRENDFHGPAMNVSAMCASGNAGLLTAKSWIDGDVADDVVFVATDVSLSPEMVDHFVRLGVAVVDTDPLDACRPFQTGSRGFPAGEASVAFVLSARRCESYASVLGGAMSHDGHHATSIDPALIHVERCVGDALARSGVAANDVTWLNAHGPGTAQCDAAEARILDEMLPGARGVFSIKPLVGHCQGAASAVETAATAMGYDAGVIPAPSRIAEAHPLLLDGPTDIGGVPRGITLKTSLGMGGHNSAVVLA